jgi:hypothetical protein
MSRSWSGIASEMHGVWDGITADLSNGKLQHLSDLSAYDALR